MIRYVYASLFLALSLCVTGCQEKSNIAYYMRHPQALQAKTIECQFNREKTGDKAAECEMVLYAAKSLVTLLSEQQANPEKFGQRVLDAETRYAGLHATELQAQQSLMELRAKQNSSAVELRNAEDDFYKAKKAADEQKQMIAVMLAVLGMSSPE